MTQILLAISCIVNTIFILMILKCVVDDTFSIKKPWLVFSLIALLGIVGGFTDIQLQGNFLTGFVLFLFPLGVYLISDSRGRKSRKWKKYFLSFIFYVAIQIISVFIEMILMSDIIVITPFSPQTLLISIIINSSVSIVLYWICIKKKIQILFSKTEWILLLVIAMITMVLIDSYGISGGIDMIYSDNLPETINVIINYSLLYFLLFLYLLFIISLIYNKITLHFKKIGEMSQEHMKQQLEYFNAYREVQEETQRFRHDMKNHLLYLNALSKEKKIDEMQEYLRTLAESWRDIPFLVSTGNHVVDTIIHGKNYTLEQNNITLKLEGIFTSNLEISPVDLCTIFANAIDNAIESNQKCSDIAARYLNIYIKSSDNHYFISFENPITEPVKIINNHIETDKKGDQHGYGLRNIESSVDKYGGYIQLNILHEKVFILEIVIPK